MTHEKIIERDDGRRVKIRVELTDRYSRDLQWRYQVYWCEPGKRTWTSATNEDSYAWRKLSYEDRESEGRRLCLTLATEQEIEAAMREMLLKIVPVV